MEKLSLFLYHQRFKNFFFIIKKVILFFRRAEPMKKKKKMDPAIVKLRKERKRKKLWRDCKRLMKLEKQLKPIDEIEIPYKLVDDRP